MTINITPDIQVLAEFVHHEDGRCVLVRNAKTRKFVVQREHASQIKLGGLADAVTLADEWMRNKGQVYADVNAAFDKAFLDLNPKGAIDTIEAERSTHGMGLAEDLVTAEEIADGALSASSDGWQRVNTSSTQQSDNEQFSVVPGNGIDSVPVFEDTEGIFSPENLRVRSVPASSPRSHKALARRLALRDGTGLVFTGKDSLPL